MLIYPCPKWNAEYRHRCITASMLNLWKKRATVCHCMIEVHKYKHTLTIGRMDN